MNILCGTRVDSMPPPTEYNKRNANHGILFNLRKFITRIAIESCNNCARQRTTRNTKQWNVKVNKWERKENVRELHRSTVLGTLKGILLRFKRIQ